MSYFQMQANYSIVTYFVFQCSVKTLAGINFRLGTRHTGTCDSSLHGSLTRSRAVQTRRLKASMWKLVRIYLVGIDRIQLVKTNLQASRPFLLTGLFWVISVLKGVHMQTLFFENEFDLHKNEHVLNWNAFSYKWFRTKAKSNSLMA